MRRPLTALGSLLIAGCLLAPASLARGDTSTHKPKPATPTNTQGAAQQKQISEAKADVAKAQGEINKIRQSIQRDFEDKPQWKKAAADMAKAKADYDAASKKVLDALHQKPEYQALVQTKELADEKMQALTKQASPDPEAVTAAGNEQTKASVALRKMEVDALDADESAADAKGRLTDAKKALSELRAKVDDACEADPQYQAAKKELDTAQAKLDKLKDALAQQNKAKSDAEHKAAANKAHSHTSGGGGSSSSSGY